MATPNPFFIVGVHRSGTTLLRYILSSHPDVYVPEESDFIPRFFLHGPKRPLSAQKVTEHLHTIFNEYRFVRDWKGEPPDPQAVWAEIASDPTPSAFLNALYTRYAQQNQAYRWGDKTPIYASYISLLHQIFPKARFIHIIRDGRDAALSMLEKYAADEFHVDVYFAAWNWVRRIHTAQKAAQYLPTHQYVEIRYENLVADPEPIVQQVCAFLELDYHPEMLMQHQLAQQQIPADSHFFANVRKPITPKKVGRWQYDLTKRDQRLVQAVQRSLLTELDYKLHDLGALSFAEHVRLLGLKGKCLTLQAGRRVLQAAGLFPPI